MKKDNQLLQRRSEQINKEYAELGKQGNKHDTIISNLSERYFLKPRTIYAIVSGEYDRRKQQSS